MIILSAVSIQMMSVDVCDQECYKNLERQKHKEIRGIIYLKA